MEYWDIYDEKKQKTGRTMKRNDWNMKPDEYHLTVLGVLKRPDGRYLITQRKLDKEWGAGWWEVPGGGVNAGEDSRDAVIRDCGAGAAGGWIKYQFLTSNINKVLYLFQSYPAIIDLSRKIRAERINKIIKTNLEVMTHGQH